MTQAVVKGPIGKEAAVLGATGRDVCRWLQWQCCGTWSVGQGLVACGDWGGDRLENSGLCLVMFSQTPDNSLLPRVNS